MINLVEKKDLSNHTCFRDNNFSTIIVRITVVQFKVIRMFFTLRIVALESDVISCFSQFIPSFVCICDMIEQKNYKNGG